MRYTIRDILSVMFATGFALAILRKPLLSIDWGLIGRAFGRGFAAPFYSFAWVLDLPWFEESIRKLANRAETAESVFLLVGTVCGVFACAFCWLFLVRAAARVTEAISGRRFFE